MNLSKKTAWRLAVTYVALVYAGLYFTPFISSFLKARGELASFINWIYIGAGLVLFFVFYFKLGIRNAGAYGILAFLMILFFAAFSRMEVSTDRLHFLEHGLVTVLVTLALSFSSSGIVLIGRTILFCSLIGLFDEGIQGLLPNRQADWNDVWSNIFAYYLAAGVVAVAQRNDFTSEKRDNLVLVGCVVAFIFWLKYASLVPHDYSFVYLLGLLFLFLPFFYLIQLKRQIYGWSGEAVFYLLFLTFTGIISFSHSILGLGPLMVIRSLYQSAFRFFH